MHLRIATTSLAAALALVVFAPHASAQDQPPGALSFQAPGQGPGSYQPQYPPPAA